MILAALLAVPVVRAPQARAAGDDVVSEASWVLSLQVASGVDKGLIEMNTGSKYCVPYFSNVAASGLADATRSTGDPKYVAGAWAWLDWYSKHMDSNGFVTNYIYTNQWVSNGKMDSTDGYAGAFLTAVKDAYVASGDDSRVNTLWPAVHKAVSAILATDNGGWLTYAKPDYPHAFIMDNVEVYEGFRAVEYLATKVHPDPVLRMVATTWTANMPGAFELYWDEGLGGYDAAIGFDGSRYLVDWNKLYPTATAQSWMIRTGLVDPARAKTLMDRVDYYFPDWPTSGTQQGVAWWPEIIEGERWGGKPARAAQGLKLMGDAVVAGGRAWPYHVGNSGRLIIQMVGEPDTLLHLGPAAYVKPGTASFSFAGISALNVTGAVTFECSLDAAPYAVCPQSYSVPGLLEGTHTIEFRVRDAAGNVDPTPGWYAWVIDATPPVAQFVSTPANPGNANPMFTFTGSDAAPPALLTYSCSLDGSPFTPCPNPAKYTLNTTGNHSFQVKATDPAGNIGTPITYAWYADATPPDTWILSGPSGTLPSGDVTFTFDGSDAQGGVTFQCRLGSASFLPCTSPQSLSVPQGSWTFQVRAVDAVGNVDPTPATQSWNVDTTPPTTTLVEAPPPATKMQSARFVFSGNDNIGGSTQVWFQCSVDGAAWTRCTSPVNLTGVASGSHTFDVRAVDGAGYIDPTPAHADWIVDFTAPVASITTADGAVLADQPPQLMRAVTGAVTDDASGVGTVSVTFTPPVATGGSAVTVQATIQCNDASRKSCTWTAKAPAKSGRYTVSGRAADAAGNQSAATPSAITVYTI